MLIARWNDVLERKPVAIDFIKELGEEWDFRIQMDLPHNDEYKKMLFREAGGGKCPKCGREWTPMTIDAPTVKGMYYDPGCNCYGRCPQCRIVGKRHTSLHRERALGLLGHCASCGWKQVEKKKTKAAVTYE